MHHLILAHLVNIYNHIKHRALLHFDLPTKKLYCIFAHERSLPSKKEAYSMTIADFLDQSFSPGEVQVIVNGTQAAIPEDFQDALAGGTVNPTAELRHSTHDRSAIFHVEECRDRPLYDDFIVTGHEAGNSSDRFGVIFRSVHVYQVVRLDQ